MSELAKMALLLPALQRRVRAVTKSIRGDQIGLDTVDNMAALAESIDTLSRVVGVILEHSLAIDFAASEEAGRAEIVRAWRKANPDAFTLVQSNTLDETP